MNFAVAFACFFFCVAQNTEAVTISELQQKFEAERQNLTQLILATHVEIEENIAKVIENLKAKTDQVKADINNGPVNCRFLAYDVENLNAESQLGYCKMSERFLYFMQDLPRASDNIQYQIERLSVMCTVPNYVCTQKINAIDRSLNQIHNKVVFMTNDIKRDSAACINQNIGGAGIQLNQIHEVWFRCSQRL